MQLRFYLIPSWWVWSPLRFLLNCQIIWWKSFQSQRMILYSFVIISLSYTWNCDLEVKSIHILLPITSIKRLLHGSYLAITTVILSRKTIDVRVFLVVGCFGFFVWLFCFVWFILVCFGFFYLFSVLFFLSVG